MPNAKVIDTFSLYRYQLVPLTQNIQYEIFGGINTYEELVNQKNNIFEEILKKKKLALKTKITEAIYKILLDQNNKFVLRIGAKRSIKHYKEDFDVEKLEDYPNIIVYIDNQPHNQLLIIEKNTRAFSSPDVVASILEESFNIPLSRYQLKIYIKPIVEKKEFWKEVKKYENRLRQLTFELIKPNMSNISRSIANGIKTLQTNTNSHITKLELNAPKKRILENISEENSEISGIVDYSNEGGGDIFFKAKGVKKRIKASKKVQKEITFEELNIRGKSPEDILTILQQISE